MSCRRARHHAQAGSAVLYAIVLSPILLLSLALAVDAGALQLQKERLRSAVDEAAVVAATATAQAGDTGVNLDRAGAVALVRSALVDNLAALQGDIDGLTAVDIARAADVAVVTQVPSPDPLDATRIVPRPAIEVRVRVPVRTGLLQLAGVPSAINLTLVAIADIRITGQGSS
jgi:Flp pilus assembly protein TadG